MPNPRSPAPPAADHWLFQRFPTIDTWQGGGATLPVPFALFEGSAYIAYGTGRKATLDQLCAGTGYKPVSDGRGRGFVELWINVYDQASLPPYEAALLFFVVTQSGPAVFPRNIDQDPYAVVLPMMTPGYFLFCATILVDSKIEDVALRYSHDVLRLPKYKGGVSALLDKATQTVAISCKTANDTHVFSYQVPADDLQVRGEGLAELSRLLGWRQTSMAVVQSQLSLHVPEGTLITRDPESELVVRQLQSRYLFNPTYSLISKFKGPDGDNFKGKDANKKDRAMGYLLHDMDFHPTVVGQDRSFRLVMYPPDYSATDPDVLQLGRAFSALSKSLQARTRRRPDEKIEIKLAGSKIMLVRASAPGVGPLVLALDSERRRLDGTWAGETRSFRFDDGEDRWPSVIPGKGDVTAFVDAWVATP